jgi:capsule polysaccharide export protein KpsE/RkpR
MYRYSGNSRYRSVMRSHRWQPVVVIALLIIAVVVILKLVGVGSLDVANYERQRNTRLRSETQNAVTQVNTLSRLGATSTSNTLGKIRQYVHGVEVINDLNISMYGEVGRLYQQSVFDHIYDIIDQYDANLSTGSKVNETLTTLTEAIMELNTLTLEITGAT